MAKKATAESEGSVQELARKKWESSGLDGDHAKRLKFMPLSKDEVENKLAKTNQAPGLFIPYFDLDGGLTSFYRIRYLTKLPGWEGMKAKQQRYAQLKGSINEVYLPPLLPTAWRDVAADPKVPLMVTEGELKAACACAHGVPTIGLGGVDTWQAKKREIELLEPLPAFEWKDRQVGIIFDSDASEKSGVVRAQLALARKLNALGAKVSIARLPPTKDGKKQGLDDYIVAEGSEALLEIIGEAETYGPGRALWELNDEVVLVRDPGIIVVRETGQRMHAKQFVTVNYSNRMHQITLVDGQGNVKYKEVPTAAEWMKWASRAEVQKIVYIPGQPKIIGDAFNVWNGWGCEPEKGDVGPFFKLLDIVFGKEDLAREWFLDWCAYPLQHPGAKLYTSAVIWGPENGTGKTLIAYALMRIYGQNATEIKNKHLRGGFNGWQENKQFIYGDEVAGGGDATAKKIDAEWLKGLITQEFVRINQKYIPEYSIPDVMNYIFSSNRADAVFMDDTDRRFFVQEVQNLKGTEEFYKECDRWLKGKGPSALFDYLLGRKLTGFNPNAAAMVTKSKKEMAYLGKSELGAWIADLRHDADELLKVHGELAAKECRLFTPGDLIRAYDPENLKRISPVYMARELRQAGFKTINGDSTVRTKGGNKRLYAIRGGEWTGSLAAAGEHYDKYLGPGANKKF